MCVCVVGVFLALGLSCLVPATHLAVLIGNHDSFLYLSLMGASYVLGAVIYATRVPESIWPGSFDTWVGLGISQTAVTAEFTVPQHQQL